MDRPYDVVIVGGGAAGLSAALVLARPRRHIAIAVLDAGAPRNAVAAHGSLLAGCHDRRQRRGHLDTTFMFEWPTRSLRIFGSTPESRASVA